MINKKYIHVLLFAVLTSCSQPKTFKVSGTINDSELEGNTVELLKEVESGVTTVWQTEIRDGKFVIEKPLDSIQSSIYYLQIDDLGETWTVVGEASDIEVTISDRRELSMTAVKGNLNRALIRMNNDVDALINNYNELYDKHQSNPEFMVEENNKLNASLKALVDSLKNAHKNDALGVVCLKRQLADYSTIEELDSAISEIPMAATVPGIMRYRQTLLNRGNTTLGKMFVDFDATTTDGKPTKLSDYVGKGEYVLVDFWASWCGPCIAELPYLRDAASKYSSKGLVVLGVNVHDQQEAFQRSIKEREMTWTNIFASYDETATDAYGIVSIPTVILFAPDGTIAHRALSTTTINEKLENIYITNNRN